MEPEERIQQLEERIQQLERENKYLKAVIERKNITIKSLEEKAEPKYVRPRPEHIVTP